MMLSIFFNAYLPSVIFFSECLFISLAYFVNELFVFYCWVLRLVYMFWIQALYNIWCVLQASSPSPWLVFSFTTVSFTEQKFLILMKFGIIFFPFHGFSSLSWIMLLVLYLKSYHQPQGHQVFSYVIYLEFI